MKLATLLTLSLALLSCAATVWAQPSGLQITGFIPEPGCPPEPSIAVISYGRISIDFSGGKFGVTTNQGRVQCRAKIHVSVPAGYQFTFADYKRNNAPAVPLQSGEVMIGGWLNGTASKALVDVSWTIPAAMPVTLSRSYTYLGGSTALPSGPSDLVFPSGTNFPYTECANVVTVRTILITIDAAAASDYTMPWPPPPVEQNEKIYVRGVRFGVKWRPCPDERSVPNPARPADG